VLRSALTEGECMKLETHGNLTTASLVSVSRKMVSVGKMKCGIFLLHKYTGKKALRTFKSVEVPIFPGARLKMDVYYH
jgi:hypothetical protein